MTQWQNVRIVCCRSGFDTGSIHNKDFKKRWYMPFLCLASSTLGKSMGVKHTVLLAGQPPTVAFTVLAELCGPKANETEMGTVLFHEKW